MAQAVTVYRWDDAGAPQLPNGKPSEIIDILTKCLVDGYGDKTPLGWTRPFYDAVNQAAAFRNSVADGGSGGYAKFFSNDGSDNNNALMRITHAASMTDINTLFRQGYTQALRATAGSGNNKTDKWLLIGTNTAFYFIMGRNVSVHAGSTSFPNSCIFVGDYYSTIPSDVSRFITLAAPAQTDTSFAGYLETLDWLCVSAQYSNSACLKLYDADGFESFIQYSLCSFTNNSSVTTNTVFNAAPPFPQGLIPVHIKATSRDQATTNVSDRFGVILPRSQVSPVYRGILPGLFNLTYIGYRDLAWPSVVEIDAQNYLPLRNPNGGPINAAINLEIWHDPFAAL
ncbi:hypothetical protein [Rheinheimera pleomorphica]|uniref:hypothetical protein n=1 Tax=Rheinheimera pleomorphica TaxID=2703963 RepID=UPI0014247FDB|nr:hypothetical protein [Rheinheimera pleomorphica]